VELLSTVSAIDRAHARRTLAATLAAALLGACLLPGLIGCGSRNESTRHLPGPGPERLNPIYDVQVGFPNTTLIVGGLSYQGVQIDLELEFVDASLRDPDPSFRAGARVRQVIAGGVTQVFELLGPLDLQGTLADGVLHSGFFGPIRVGTSNLILDLTGEVTDQARRVEGSAALFGTNDTGAFSAVKRRRYLIAGTDLSSAVGQVSVLSVRDGHDISIQENLEATSSDPVARVSDARPFIVNRLRFDNLEGLDPASFRALFQYSTGAGSNPHDVVVLPEENGDPSGGLACVARYEAPYSDVAFFDLASGALVDRIDLTPYAMNPDHLPRPDRMLLHDGLLFVTLQDINAVFTDYRQGRMVVIDPLARRVLDVFDLSGRNPFESLFFSDATGLIYVGLAGIFPGRLDQSLSGGIETVDPVARRPLGLLVDDDDLGGNVSAVALPVPGRGYCVVTDATYHNFVKAFDPATGAVLGTIVDSPDQITTLVADGDGFLLVGIDSFFDPRILILDGATGALVASVPLRLPPQSIAILTRSL
jgi:hypothetical protein